jgi:type II secretory pathway predicted ATPase ExeA
MADNPLGLRENPFAASRDPHLIYPSRSRLKTLARLRQSLADGEPLVLITGESGTGKTSTVSEALESWGPRISAAFMTAASPARPEPLQEICHRLGLARPDPASRSQALSQLAGHLSQARGRGELTVLVLDDAHVADDTLLGEIGMLLDLESEGRRLLQVVLVGRPEIEKQLALPGLAQLRQRIAVHCRLQPFAPGETERFIHQRVSASGGNAADILARETCLAIHQVAGGIARAVEALAGQALLIAGREGAGAVAPEHVRAAAAAEACPPGTVAAATAVPKAARVEPGLAAPSSCGDPEMLAGPAAGSESSLEPRRSDDPAVRAWVSRFVGPDGPPRIGIRTLIDPEDLGPAGEPSESDSAPHPPHAASPPVGAAAELEEASPTLPAAPHPPGRAVRDGRSRSAGSDGVSRLTHAALALLVLGAAGFLILRMLSIATNPGRSPVAGARPAAVASSPTVGSSAQRSARLGPDGLAAESAPSRIGAAVSTPRTISAAPQAPVPRFGLEVGSYINPDRAAAERERIAESTHRAVRVLAFPENGGITYRVLLGSFRSRGLAERAAAQLLESGIVNQARATVLAAGDSLAR